MRCALELAHEADTPERDPSKDRGPFFGLSAKRTITSICACDPGAEETLLKSAQPRLGPPHPKAGDGSIRLKDSPIESS